MRGFGIGVRWILGLGVASALIVTAPEVQGAGFGIFEQGSKSMGMAMAFTAQADDPSAMFYNVGGLGFFEDRAFLAGATLIALGDSEFEGGAPFPGPDQSGNQVNRILTPVHFYWVEPLGDGKHWKLGLALNSPFGLATEWEHPDTWSGRFLNEKAELRTYDFNPSIGWRAGDTLGIGFGLVARFSDVDLKNRSAAINPFTSSAVEVAKASLSSDLDTGYGFNFGILHRATSRFSWGLSYRSKIKVDYSGDARLTQVLTGDPVFDAIVASSTPFDQDLPIETSIEFPDLASLGFAYRFGSSVLAELDVNRTGWSSFDRLDIDFSNNPELDTSIPENWDDAINVRLGVRYTTSPTSEWRFGAYYDETPQPDESVSPLLPDADRNGFTVGYGWSGKRVHADFALLYVKFKDRTTTVNRDNFNGEYKTNVWLLGATLGW